MWTTRRSLPFRLALRFPRVSTWSQLGPSGDTIANAVSTKQAAGLDSYGVKMMFGDWVYWNDQANGIVRLVFASGLHGPVVLLICRPSNPASTSHSMAPLETQKSGTPNSGQTNGYSQAELAQLLGNGIDVIANPQPGGTFWGGRGRSQFLLERCHKRRQLHSANELHCRNVSCWDGALRRASHQYKLVSTH